MYLYLFRVFNIGNREIAESEFLSKDAIYTIVEYQGDIVDAVSKIPNAKVFAVDESRAILSVIGDVNEVIDKLYDVMSIPILVAYIYWAIFRQ